MRAYLDHAATTGTLCCAQQAMLECLELGAGNPASLHGDGRDARRLLEDARERTAAALGAHPLEVVFTSGGTEANNLAVKGAWWAAGDRARAQVLVGATEHHAVLEPAKWLAGAAGAAGSALGIVPVDGMGQPDLEALRARLQAATGSVLVAIMWANNEVGAVADVAKMQEVCEESGAVLHTDAVAAFATVPVQAGAANTLALSSHKFGGPPGVGALVVRRGHRLTPLLHGGGQEGGVRSGTPNLPAIVGMSVAAQWVAANRAAESTRLALLATRLSSGILAAAPDALPSGPPPGPQRLVGTVHFCFPGLRGETILALLDRHGISASSGAACNAGVQLDSHVLAAMGYDRERSMGAIRFSLGHSSTAADVDAALAVLPSVLDQARSAASAGSQPWRERGQAARRVASGSPA